MCSSKWLSVNETVQFVIMMHHFFFQAKSWRSPSDSSNGTVLFSLMAICCVSAALLIRINAPRTPWCCRYRPALHLFGARAEVRRLSVSVGASSSIKRGSNALLLLLSEPSHYRETSTRSVWISVETNGKIQCFGY